MAESELTGQIQAVRDRAKPVLASFSKLDAEGCTESYLFKDEHFFGLKILLGHFQARWELGQATIEISRGPTLLQTLDVVESNHQVRHVA